MPNRLANETSPYLRQHADNPVDWYPWGEDALERARRENKPILLSIGYAACHWCHVMAHESFENEQTAVVMNERFVNIKVDREERPDIDAIYMQAVQAMTGQGGWPMTMFLTPAGEPFYGGTYFPPTDRQGLPSFTKVLTAVSEAYQNRLGEVHRTAEQIRQIYRASESGGGAPGAVTPHTLDLAYRGLAHRYDPNYGGFEGAPKFPPTMSMDFLLRYWSRSAAGFSLEMVLETFRRMARGGIYDQIGGGFHRYSVDAFWLVPHFEKMLYDNALLTRLGANLWQATKDEEVRRVTEETVTWVLREMTDPEGGFYSSLDADSEGEEGKFYVWSPSDLDSLLGEDSALIREHYGVTPEGNFEGHNILNVRAPFTVVAARHRSTVDAVAAAITKAKPILYEARSKRVWPGRDEKILAGWNGLMLRGLATAARAFDRDDFRDAAIRNAEFLQREMTRNGRVMRSYMQGEARIAGFLEDHASVALGFIAVYELTFDVIWIERAAILAERIVEHFWDPSTNVLYDTADDAESLITRPRDFTDNAIPSGTSLAADLFAYLGVLKDDSALTDRARAILEGVGAVLSQHPAAFGHLLGVADFLVYGPVELAIVGQPVSPDFARLVRTAAQTWVPSLVLAGGSWNEQQPVALLRDRPDKSAATAYVCRSYVCDEPTTDGATLERQLSTAGRRRDVAA
jgi:uncharacterized protein